MNIIGGTEIIFDSGVVSEGRQIFRPHPSVGPAKGQESLAEPMLPVMATYDASYGEREGIEVVWCL